MHSSPRLSWAGLALALLALAAATTVGFLLRLADPLTTPIIPAEDPYTHMALVREHLRTGTLDPLYPKSTLYPPGLHAFLAAAWSYTGTDLGHMVLWGPPVLGAIGILGVGLLLARNHGLMAAFVGSLSLAVAPEAIFRTNMMSPTALDLALLPFCLYALLEVFRGRMAWLAVAAPLFLFLVFSHPWVFPILSIMGLAFLALAWALPWPNRFPTFSPMGIAGALACVGGGLGVALTTCGGLCGPGLRDILALPPNVTGMLPFVVLALSLAPLALLALPGVRRRIGAWNPAKPRPLLVRLGASVAIAAVLAAMTRAALRDGLPAYVNLPGMFGWPILVLAFAALIALPFVAGPAAYVGASLFAATYPFVVTNPLQSEFWPHRTAVYLGVALVVLAGVAAGEAAHGIARAWHAWTSRGKRRSAARPNPAGTPTHSNGHPGSSVALTLLILAVPAVAGGAVYAATPDGYAGGWYRLYPACEMEALRAIVEEVNADGSVIVLTGDWQAKLVMAAYANDASRIQYIPSFFTLPQSRHNAEARLMPQHTLLVVVERYVSQVPDADPGFLEEPPYRPAQEWCSRNGMGHSMVKTYTTAGDAG